MELCTLHPFDECAVAEFVSTIENDAILTTARDRLARGDQRGADQLTHALAQLLARREPSFYHPGLSLTGLEARIDRGVGMLLRPPARIFVEAGFDEQLARRLPIRLDLSKGMMGGAFIPARLVPSFSELIETKLE